jgi:hypothetical protein
MVEADISMARLSGHEPLDVVGARTWLVAVSSPLGRREHFPFATFPGSDNG